MVANPDFKNISIDSYEEEIFPNFMLALCIFVTSALTLVYVGLIANIQC